MRVLVGLSGGVDSAVCATLLKQQGHEVVGVLMQIWEKGTFSSATEFVHKGCFSPHIEADLKSVQEIASSLDIEYHLLDCSAAYKKFVLNGFRQDYLDGKTPNPCIRCNEKIKFDMLPLLAKEHGIQFDKFATGHYANISFNEETKRYELLKGSDEKKDQSYFLYRLSQEQLGSTLFPLGNQTKEETRLIAQQNNLAVSKKVDSQDFYTGDINDILQNTPREGRFITKDGEVLGKHQGFWNYTIGQRKGLGLSAKQPLYVLELDAKNNDVILGFENENTCQSLIATDVRWSSMAPTTSDFKAFAKCRSSQKPTPVSVSVLNENEMKIDFDVLQKGLAAGQSVVLYDDNKVLCGGFIASTIQG